ncbi:SIMPL domain-containing protein [Siphonobacter aquaeclarae]|uniref:DUF541 domain-containing protein n=1 Tax=Siphonobacter aquaeclarae TaxID=563176 RepID=A0A1G9M9Z3_9BACT|nr:SIMPL domain-containing protein [Siphonobacter aquaeclarae]SDL71068.1 hypothetical protein SAMN04488090_1512 [Siphonobacter aquaeclarae]
MKKLLLIAATLFATSSTFAQNVEKEPVRKIEVTGTSEVEVDPDEFYIGITLREFFKDEKNQKDKVSIDVLEKQLIESVKAAGIAKEDLTIGGVNGFQTYSPKKKPAQFLESKQYILKLSKLYNLDVILSKVDSRGVNNTYMNRVEYSKKEQIKKEVKIKALLDAKEKAKYLVEALGGKLGDVLIIQEIEEGYAAPVMYRSQMMMAKTEAAGADVAPSDLEYQKIKISYKMQVAFRIQ